MDQAWIRTLHTVGFAPRAVRVGTMDDYQVWSYSAILCSSAQLALLCNPRVEADVRLLAVGCGVCTL
jgi:hypothetical protein